MAEREVWQRDRTGETVGRETYHTANTQKRQTNAMPPASAYRRPEQRTTGTGYRRPAQRNQNTRRRRRRRSNWKSYIVLGILALVIFGLAIWLISAAVRAIAPNRERIPPSTMVSETEEPTEAPEAQIRRLIDRADFLAAGYDYDAAVQTLKEFGPNWQQQPELAAADQRYASERQKLVRWGDTTQITHIFFHSLIVDTARAFDEDYTNDGYNQYMATVDEFRAILDELYARGFVLVRMHDIAKLTTDENGNQVYEQGDIYLPPGKQPIIISQDDVNYYEYMVDSDGDRYADAGGDGFANRIVIDENGYPTCEYVTADGQTVYGEYDLVPILEAFVQKHPDFSYRGARAILGVTGYEGVWGYKTHPEWKEILGQNAYDEEFRAAQELTECLKAHGWEIASHSFGHPAYGSISAERVAADVQKWEDQVQPVVGDTDIFIYPYGSDIAGIERYDGPKFDAMYEAGYRFFCNVDSTKYWVQIHDDYVRQGRRNIDGYRMWWGSDLLDDLFDVDKIFDKARPTPVPSVV